MHIKIFFFNVCKVFEKLNQSNVLLIIIIKLCINITQLYNILKHKEWHYIKDSNYNRFQYAIN